MGNSWIADEYITERVDEENQRAEESYSPKLQEFFLKQGEAMMVQILMVLVLYSLPLHYSPVKIGNVKLPTMSLSMKWMLS